MNNLPIQPLQAQPRAAVRLPGSKSITNRALLLAALAEGDTTLEGALFSDDTLYFQRALENLGFTLSSYAEAERIVIRGQAGKIPSREAQLFVGNAGTAARFIAALLTLGNGEFHLDGDARMRERPFRPLAEALQPLGGRIEPASNGSLPVTIRAKGLQGGATTISADLSSQFLSALLMVAPYAQTPVEIRLTTPLTSEPYIHLTIAMMKEFSVEVLRPAPNRFTIPPSRYQSPRTYPVEPDASNASYFMAIPAICDGSIEIRHLRPDSLQGDVAFAQVLEQMGCETAWTTSGLQVSAPLAGLHGITADMTDIPDTAQTLAAIAPFASSPTTIHGIASARGKETDRIQAVCTELRRLGVQVDEHADGMTIFPAHTIQPAQIHTYADHRMAMAFSLIGLRVPGIVIQDPGCVSKTFPQFFSVLESVRRRGNDDEH